MLTDETDYINYFQNLAIADADLQHFLSGKSSFFVVDDAFDLEEIDEAVRNKLKFPAMLLDIPDGALGLSNSNNKTDTITGIFMFLLNTKSNLDKRTARATAKNIGKRLLKKIHEDSRASLKTANWFAFDYNDVKYQPVGPICEAAYGMQFMFKITSPFSLA